jgi:hypothetical protein
MGGRVRGEAHTGCWCENFKEKEHLEDKGVDKRKPVKRTFK